MNDRRLSRWIRIGLLLALVIAFAGSLIYWLGLPRLLAVSPLDDASSVPGGAPLRLEFSHPMQPDSVIERLSLDPSVDGSYAWPEPNVLVFTPAQPWPAEETIRVRLEPGALSAGLLPLPLTQGASWEFRIGAPRLAYLYPNNGPANIYVLNPMSGESKPWTASPGGLEDFSVSPDGSAIYYSVRSVQGQGAIYRLNLIGLEESGELPEPALVIECPHASCRRPVVSPTGEYLAYERTALLGSGEPDYPQVWLLSLTPSGLPALEAQPFQAGDLQHQTLLPAWSSKGVLAFYDTNAGEFVFMQPGGGVVARFPNQTGQQGDWHPDGESFVAPEIFFLDEGVSEELTELSPLANSHLISFNLADKASRDITQIEALEDIAPAFSQDGVYLVFARKFLDIERWTPGRQIWLLHLRSGESRPLTNDALYNHYQFAWSPTGEMLAYVRFDQGALNQPPEVWLVDPRASQATRIIVGGYAPLWVP